MAAVGCTADSREAFQSIGFVFDSIRKRLRGSSGRWARVHHCFPLETDSIDSISAFCQIRNTMKIDVVRSNGVDCRTEEYYYSVIRPWTEIGVFRILSLQELVS